LKRVAGLSSVLVLRLSSFDGSGLFDVMTGEGEVVLAMVCPVLCGNVVKRTWCDVCNTRRAVRGTKMAV